MDAPFVYVNPVTGRNFVGRKTECTVLANLLEAGENVCLYEAPKAGKTSLVQQTLYNMRAAGKPFMVAYVNVLNVRSKREFLKKLGGAVLRAAYSTPSDYSSAMSEYLDIPLYCYVLPYNNLLPHANPLLGLHQMRL